MNQLQTISTPSVHPFAVTFNNFNEVSEPMFNAWIEYLDVKETTLKSYTKNIFRFANYLKENQITRPVRADIIRYRDELAKTHKPNTVNTYLMAIKQFFTWASSEGIYPNVAANIKPLKTGKDFKRQHLTTRQSKTLLCSIDISTRSGLRDYAMILLMLTTGLRTIEIMRANIEDIRPRGDSMVLYVQGKGHDDKDAYVKLAPITEDAINRYLASKPQQKTGPLFTSVSNRNCLGRMTTNSISRIVKTYLRGIDLDRAELTAHSLRHTCATLNILYGGSVKETQELLRHENPSTSEIYIHSLDREQNNSEMRIESALFS